MTPPGLDRWIGTIWSSDTSPISAASSIGPPTSIDPASAAAMPAERRLPDGGSHLVVRLDDAPLWIMEAGASPEPASPMPAAALAGARMRALLRRSARLSCSVGVPLKPGATLALFGVPAGAIAGRHVDLHDLCGSEADRLVERLRTLDAPQARIAAMTRWLAGRLRQAEDHDRGSAVPAFAALAAALVRDEPVAALARRIGWSQKRLVAFWRERTGLTPKQHQRLLRLRRALALAGPPATPQWAIIAAECGYSDQAHLCREFADLTGLTPGEWRRRRGAHPLHVAEPPWSVFTIPPSDDFLQDRRARAML